MMYRRLWVIVLAALVTTVVLGVSPRSARATLRFGDLQISGNAQSQNLFRTPDASTWEYIQNRNTAHLRLDYDWLQGGKFITKYDIPFIEKSSLSLLWRGVYDGIYGFTPGFLQKEDIHGRNYTGPNGGLNYFQYATQVGIPASKSGQPNQKLTIPQLGLNSLGQSGLDTGRLREPAARALCGRRVPQHPAPASAVAGSRSCGARPTTSGCSTASTRSISLASPAGDSSAGIRGTSCAARSG